ncbi:polyprenyl synthetase family protein [Solwaraspora sp. WMMA2065]|uniref:polyprenyl synthetase family protein n=1 Tax=Solwaraspora sp. WMMA2065 TaxID=3015166 RepID=UPI00259B287F|nr:polyprenyl synthetase family protein [Solwaraspora sp. WMMA2065]WJK33230.1 polyprenyl synthetase family protein [Solwaraspora sp. WMMA2065]
MANHTVAGTDRSASVDEPAGSATPGSPPPRRRDLLTAAVDDTLIDFLTVEIDALDRIDPALRPFAQVARDTVLAGGKRLRPVFAHWGWRGVVGPDAPLAPVLPALAALELLHAFALVHDDVMDGSATRRGRPTAHRRLAGQHRSAGRDGDPDRFGDGAAVLVGDLCLVWADRLLGQAGVPPRTLLDVRRRYDQMRVETIAGQYLDVLGETEADSWSVDRALRVARHKTASYTVLRPLHLGAALAGPGADPAVHEAYRRYGTAVGEAFQLRDDLLGVLGDPATTGKPAGDDLRTGKPTVLLLIARELATEAQRAELNRPPPATDRQSGRNADRRVQRLIEIVVETGAAGQVEQLIEQRVREAVDALADAPIDPAARRALTGLAVTATTRQA